MQSEHGKELEIAGEGSLKRIVDMRVRFLGQSCGVETEELGGCDLRHYSWFPPASISPLDRRFFFCLCVFQNTWLKAHTFMIASSKS